MYQALYRKWRPQTFDDVIGQKHITDSLRNQVSSGRLSHAYIFIGSRGTGKTTCARILAKAVNCEHPVNGNPCCECESCRRIAEGSVMDIVELDAASNNGVDNVRALRDEAVFSPADVRKRVYIIDEVHMLSSSAFNALLKIIEEPPEHLMFILATTELQKVPATILSRCQRHSFKRIDRQVLCGYIEHVAECEKIGITHEAADIIAGLAEGGVRDALSMLDQCSAYGDIGAEQVYAAVGLAGNVRITELYGHICSHDSASAVRLFGKLWEDGKNPASVLRELSSLMRDILLVKVAPDSCAGLVYGGYGIDTLKTLGAGRTAEELIAALNTLENTLGSMSVRFNPKMSAELCLISLCTGLGADSIEDIRGRVSALERAFSEGDVPAIAAGTPAAEQREQRTANLVPVKKAVQNHAPQGVPSVAVNAAPVPQAQKTAVADLAAADKPDRIKEQKTDDWKKICSYVGPLLPRDMAVMLGSPDTVSGYLSGDTLFVEVGNSFYYSRFCRSEIISHFEAGSSVVVGRKLNVKITEKGKEASQTGITEKRQAAPKADLNELRAFAEVTFADE